MQKNTASQKVIVFAFDSTTNTPKTGDAANITAYISKDFGAVTVLTDTTATEMDATNAKGYYLFDITQTETNADVILVSAKSSTANIVVVGAPATIATYPAGGIASPTNITAITGNITGNLSGSVGSVTGAVGSVTGNVGGNVTGSVGSVVGAVGSVTGAVGSVTGLTASDVAAIKAKTDSLTYTVAGQVDANVQSVNDVLLQGAGVTGNSWRPV